jgi:hypothetical protein
MLGKFNYLEAPNADLGRYYYQVILFSVDLGGGNNRLSKGRDDLIF